MSIIKGQKCGGLPLDAVKFESNFRPDAVPCSGRKSMGMIIWTIKSSKSKSLWPAAMCGHDSLKN